MWTVYILSSHKNWTLYTWVTSDIEKRIYDHKKWKYWWFTKKYRIHSLVRYQEYSTIQEAIEMEKIIKGKSRIYKIKLIEENNNQWLDLARDRYINTV